MFAATGHATVLSNTQGAAHSESAFVKAGGMDALRACTKSITTSQLEIGEDPANDLSVTLQFVFENEKRHPYFGERDQIADESAIDTETGSNHIEDISAISLPQEKMNDDGEVAKGCLLEDSVPNNFNSPESKSSFGSSGTGEVSLSGKSDIYPALNAVENLSGERNTPDTELAAEESKAQAQGAVALVQKELQHVEMVFAGIDRQTTEHDDDEPKSRGDIETSHLPDTVWIKRTENISELCKRVSEGTKSSSPGEELQKGSLRETLAILNSPAMREHETVTQTAEVADFVTTTRKPSAQNASLPEADDDIQIAPDLPRVVHAPTKQGETPIPDRAKTLNDEKDETVGCAALRTGSIRGAMASLKRTLSKERQTSCGEAMETTKSSSGSGGFTAHRAGADEVLPEIKIAAVENSERKWGGLVRKSSRLASRMKKLFSRDKAEFENPAEVPQG